MGKLLFNTHNACLMYMYELYVTYSLYKFINSIMTCLHMCHFFLFQAFNY